MSPRFVVKAALLWSGWDVLLRHGPSLLRVASCESEDLANFVRDYLTTHEDVGKRLAEMVVSHHAEVGAVRSRHAPTVPRVWIDADADDLDADGEVAS